MEGTACPECPCFWRCEGVSTLNNSIANDALTIVLDGRVDSKNVKQVEADIN